MTILDTIKSTAKSINEGTKYVDGKGMDITSDDKEDIRKEIVKYHRPMPKPMFKSMSDKNNKSDDDKANDPFKKAIEAIQKKFAMDYFADLKDKNDKSNTKIKEETMDEGILSGIGSVIKGTVKTAGQVANKVANMPGDMDKLHPITTAQHQLDQLHKTAHDVTRSFVQKRNISSGTLQSRASKVGKVHTGMTQREEIEIDEKHLTPAELKKREQVAKAIERENPDMPMDKKMAIATATAKKAFEDVGLEEGRGRPPKEGSKAWHAAQAKSKSGEVDDSYEADKNIRTQLQKAISVGKSVTFNNGETKKIAPAHAHKALSMLDNAVKPSDKENIQKSLGHSHDRFHETLKTGKPIVDASKPNVSLGKMKAESVFNEDIMVSDHSPQKTTIKIINGVPKLVKVSPPRQKINVESTETLNNLYNDLNEENKLFFDTMVKTEQGLADLLDFAIKQGY